MNAIEASPKTIKAPSKRIRQSTIKGVGVGVGVGVCVCVCVWSMQDMTKYVSALSVQKTVLLGRKRAKQLVPLPPLKENSGNWCDTDRGCLFFRMIETIAGRKELMSLPFASSTSPLNEPAQRHQKGKQMHQSFTQSTLKAQKLQ
jgi:hypothetical protein